MPTLFSAIAVRNWRQFRHINIEVHPRLTILTGANGAGKSTILNIFAQHVGFNKTLVGTPTKKDGGPWVYDTGIYDVSDAEKLLDETYFGHLGAMAPFIEKIRASQILSGYPSHMMGDMTDIGLVTYANGQSSSIQSPKTSNAYGLNIQQQQQIIGLYISPNKVVTPYQQVNNISLQGISVDQAYNNYQSELNSRYHGSQSTFGPLYRIKEAIISQAAFGEGNSYLQGNSALLDIFNHFIDILRITLPEELGFQTIYVRVPDIVLKTKSGEFVVDASSGGIGSIVELSWQILMFSKTTNAISADGAFVVVMDEPENHLHPSMQRTILPRLMQAFPKAQFIIATHSPFVVSSVEDSYVYALRYRHTDISDHESVGGADRVYATLLSNITKSGTATEILREVLGVPVTFPDWATDKIDDILDRLGSKSISRETLDALRAELQTEGLSSYYPQALDKLVSRI